MPIDSIEKALLAAIAKQETIVNRENDRLVTLRVELKLHQLNKERIPDWIKPEYTKVRTVTQAVLNALEHNRFEGVFLKEFEKYLESVKLEFHRPTISATLGRLKREGKVIRESGGRWKLNTLANRPKENEIEEV